MALDETAWAAIEKAYVETEELLADLGKRFGISASQISHRALVYGWPSRWARMGRKPRRKTMSTRKARDQLIHRLYRAIDLKLERLETRMESGEELTPAETERNLRALATMIGGFEKVAEVAFDAEKERKGATKRKKTSAPDAERMRREIAERLERLQHKRDAD